MLYNHQKCSTAKGQSVGSLELLRFRPILSDYVRFGIL
jgi:hypothetical protein